MRQYAYQARQKGAVAIEFAALFVLFFSLLFGIVAYSLPILLEISFRHISTQAGREVLRVDPAAANYPALLSRQVTNAINNSWLPAGWRTGGCPAPDSGHTWQPLPSHEGNPVFGHYAEDDDERLLHVCLQRVYNPQGPESNRAIIPHIELAGISIPTLPKNEQGDVVLKGENITRL